VNSGMAKGGTEVEFFGDGTLETRAILKFLTATPSFPRTYLSAIERSERNIPIDNISHPSRRLCARFPTARPNSLLTRVVAAAVTMTSVIAVVE
jgi:hypothetical protein